MAKFQFPKAPVSDTPSGPPSVKGKSDLSFAFKKGLKKSKGKCKGCGKPADKCTCK